MSSGQPRSVKATGVSGRPANPARLAVAVLLILGGGLIFLGLYRSRGHQQPVLVMAHDVPAGQAIRDQDLAVAEVAATGVDVVPAASRNTIVGGVAKVALGKGALLSPAQVVRDNRVGEGDALVALAFADVSVPRSLRNEDNVRLVVGDRVVDARVTDIRPASSTGTVSITFAMLQESARTVAVGKDVRLLVVPTGSPAAGNQVAGSPVAGNPAAGIAAAGAPVASATAVTTLSAIKTVEASS